MINATYCLETAQVCGIEGASKTSGRGADTLHEERDAEGVEALPHEELRLLLVSLDDAARHSNTYVNTGWRWPGVVSSEDTRDVLVAELGARLVYTEELELGAATRAYARAGGDSSRGAGSRSAGRCHRRSSGGGRAGQALGVVCKRENQHRDLKYQCRRTAVQHGTEASSVARGATSVADTLCCCQYHILHILASH